jgi:hypothetical protein
MQVRQLLQQQQLEAGQTQQHDEELTSSQAWSVRVSQATLAACHNRAVLCCCNAYAVAATGCQPPLPSCNSKDCKLPAAAFLQPTACYFLLALLLSHPAAAVASARAHLPANCPVDVAAAVLQGRSRVQMVLPYAACLKAQLCFLCCHFLAHCITLWQVFDWRATAHLDS